MIMRLQIRSWQVKAWKYIIPAAGRAFVEVVSIPFFFLGIWGSVLIANQSYVQKQRLKHLKKL
jgi:hypothetical protein